MFDFVHKNKWLIQILLVLIAVPFAFFGLDSFTSTMFRGGDEVAKVDGVAVSQREFADALRQHQDRLRAMFGAGVDVSEMDTAETRQLLVESLIDQKLLANTALKAHLAGSDDALRELIASIPAFQSDGKFSKVMYESQLRAQGMEPTYFEAQMRRDMGTSQLTGSISEFVIVSRGVAQRLASLENEAREVSEVILGPQPYLTRVTIDDAKAKAHYDANPADFRLAERLKVEYVSFSATDLERAEGVSEKELREAYQARVARRGDSDQRRASHILIAVPSDAKDDARKAAREKAETILAELRKAPERFAQLAKKHSQDPGSAENGGDLGFFGSGMMVKAFEETAFGLKKVGEISNVVESEFGYHVIRLTGIKGSKAPGLDQLSGELRAEIKRQKSVKKFAQEGGVFKDMVYEQPDSLMPAAEQFKLAVRHSGWIAKTASAAELGPLANAKVLGALFSAESIRTRRNIDAVEVSPNTLLAARVVDYQPAAQRPFDEVKGEILALLRKREAAGLARAEGAAKLEQLMKGDGAGLKWGKSRVVSRRDTKGIRADAMQRIVGVDARKLPAYVGADLGDGGYALYRVEKVLPETPRTSEQAKVALARTERMAGRSQYAAFLANLRAGADVKIYKELLAKKQ
ncbi:MAG: SurA N-terminal domain-containing protein [Betaproteobacteria bacterium]|nr:SurA N-terminal domain-containing protein [Betaproteobacteria bacterium]